MTNHTRVLLLCSDHYVGSDVKRIMARAGLRVVDLAFHRPSLEHTRAANCLVVEGGSLKQPPVSSLEELNPLISVVRVSRWKRALEDDPGDCFLGDEEELRTAVVAALLEGFSRRVIDGPVTDLVAPPILKSALRAILIRHLLHPNRGGTRRFRPTIRRLARELGVSSSYLSRLGRANEVNLRLIANRWLLAQGQLLWQTGRTWESVASIAGYRSLSGLAQLCRRTLDRTLSSLHLLGAEEMLTDLWDMIRKESGGSGSAEQDCGVTLDEEDLRESFAHRLSRSPRDRTSTSTSPDQSFGAA